MYEDKVIVSRSLMEDIGDATREKLESTALIKGSDIPSNIRAIVTNPPLQRKTAITNGTVSPDSGYYGLSSVIINVNNSANILDGYLVNFYNQDGTLIELHSAMCGMYINAPLTYECDSWKDLNGNTITFPITSATANDIINLYAFTESEVTEPTVIFNAGDESLYMWQQENRTAYGWGKSTPCYNYQLEDVQTFNQIDCTNYNYCIVRINGYISGEPSGKVASHAYMAIGFTTNGDEAIEKVNGENLIHKWESTEEGNVGRGTDGLAYNTWYDLVIDISALTGIQTLNVFFGEDYNCGGVVKCSKITLTNEI